jgi:hypothetical protein
MTVTIQNTTQTGANIDQALDNASRIYLEDASGNNLNNGIQQTNTDLLQEVYPSKFPNMLSQVANKAFYVIDCPSEDPVKAYKKGIVAGARNAMNDMRVAIVANASATRKICVTAWVYRHVRLEGGKLRIY